MKTHSTNYYDTFIEVADDTKAVCGTPPSSKAKKTVAEMQYELISRNPYKYTSDEVLFQVFADRNALSPEEYEQARTEYFSKGQACLRTSPLPKTHGFGIHSNQDGKIALYGMETEQYKQYLTDKNVKKIKAMKSSR